MAELTLRSPGERPLKEAVEAALQNEQRLLEAGIHRTEERIHAFERHFGMSTAEFLRRHEQNELEETLESIEWMGECRMLERLREKARTLQQIDFAN